MGFAGLGYLNQRTDRYAEQKGVPTVIAKKKAKKEAR